VANPVIIDEYTVEIWFPLQKDADGYPRSKQWEQLLGHPLIDRDDYFQIESVPFYLTSVSRGDIVKALITRNKELSDDEIFEFDHVIDRGAHNTYRLLLTDKRPGDPEVTEAELLRMGLVIESQDGDFFAVDVPPSVDQTAVDNYLVREAEQGRWSLQDGYLHTIRTTLNQKNECDHG
jgi:hypothetical protein